MFIFILMLNLLVKRCYFSIVVDQSLFAVAHSHCWLAEDNKIDEWMDRTRMGELYYFRMSFPNYLSLYLKVVACSSRYGCHVGNGILKCEWGIDSSIKEILFGHKTKKKKVKKWSEKNEVKEGNVIKVAISYVIFFSPYALPNQANGTKK